MKRFIVVLFAMAAMLVAFSVMGQTPAASAGAVIDSAKLPAFEAYIGAGQVATSTAGNAVAYHVDWQTQVTAGFRYFPTERFAVEAQYIHDTVSIGRWLEVHNFMEPQPVTAYKYSSLSVQAEYWILRDAKGGLYAFAGPDYFFSTAGYGGKVGVVAGVGGQWCVWKGLFFESKAAYVHVQDYLAIPVVNTYQASVSVGYRF